MYEKCKKVAVSSNKLILKMVLDGLKTDLIAIAKIVNSAKGGLPKAEKPIQLSLSTLIFYSDAAGASYSMVGIRRVFHNNENKGVSCIGGTCLKDLWIWTRGIDHWAERQCWPGAWVKISYARSHGNAAPLCCFSGEKPGKKDSLHDKQYRRGVRLV